MNKKNNLFAALIFPAVFFIFAPLYAQIEEQESSAAAFLQGTSAYRAGEWVSAVFLLRKAVSYPENFSAEIYYMLISAEMYAGEYKAAFEDCEAFLLEFEESRYSSYVLYHKGRSLFYLGEYEKSILILSDFCHHYPEHEMYAAALFWIAESFYAGYNYEDARYLYLRVVNEFASDSKAAAAQFRIDSISQISREEKLLYLLKETGEEYLAAKEEYERQLKLSGSESAYNMRNKIIELQKKNSSLEKRIAELEGKTYIPPKNSSSEKNIYEESIPSENILKENASEESIPSENIPEENAFEESIPKEDILEENVPEIEDSNTDILADIKEKALKTQQLIKDEEDNE